jgi:hypothetical protein
MIRSKRSARLTWRDHVRHNWKFATGILVLSAVVAIGTGIATQGVENMMNRASLAVKAVNDPSKLSQEEKNQLRQMVKEKGLKDAYANMSAEQKQQARGAVGGMSEEDKKRYKALLGAK